ncbi:MAG: hypothetical protein U0U46_11480 [Saprospiraceae bacterium]
MFYTGGTYNGTTIPGIANNNCFVYKQIIKVIDTQAPTANCPASPVEFCDLTVNNPQLWNEMYWWDGVIGQHDLCEGPSGPGNDGNRRHARAPTSTSNTCCSLTWTATV